MSEGIEGKKPVAVVAEGGGNGVPSSSSSTAVDSSSQRGSSSGRGRGRGRGGRSRGSGGGREGRGRGRGEGRTGVEGRGEGRGGREGRSHNSSRGRGRGGRNHSNNNISNTNNHSNNNDNGGRGRGRHHNNHARKQDSENTEEENHSDKKHHREKHHNNNNNNTKTSEGGNEETTSTSRFPSPSPNYQRGGRGRGRHSYNSNSSNYSRGDGGEGASGRGRGRRGGGGGRGRGGRGQEGRSSSSRNPHSRRQAHPNDMSHDPEEQHHDTEEPEEHLHEEQETHTTHNHSSHESHPEVEEEVPLYNGDAKEQARENLAESETPAVIDTSIPENTATAATISPVDGPATTATTNSTTSPVPPAHLPRKPTTPATGSNGKAGVPRVLSRPPQHQPQPAAPHRKAGAVGRGERDDNWRSRDVPPQQPAPFSNEPTEKQEEHGNNPSHKQDQDHQPHAEESTSSPQNQEEKGQNEQEHPDSNNNSTSEAAKNQAKNKKSRNQNKKRKDKHKKQDVAENNETTEDAEAAPPEAPAATVEEALEAMPAQEVSITANTQVKIRRNESSASLKNANTAGGFENHRGPSKIVPDSSSHKKGKSKRGKGKGLSTDASANQKAARRFNNEVRACVDRGDADGMRVIMHDKYNHHFALDHMVLETVMKAYVVAAMFEDALYCLRNVTLPGTLSTAQTERILSCLPQNLRNSTAYTAADMIDALCIATEFDTPKSRTYFMRIVRGIALEFLEEATSARDRICSAPCERLVRAGLCVVQARLRRGKKPTELVVVPGDQLGVFISDAMENRGIQAGDAVSILPYAGPYPMSAESLDRNMIEATVTNTNPTITLRLQDKANANLYAILTESTEGNTYRVDKLANRMGFNRQLAAAVAIASPLMPGNSIPLPPPAASVERDEQGNVIRTNQPPPPSPTYHRDPRRPSPQLIKAITAMDESIDRVMNKSQNNPMRQGELTSTAALCSEAIPWLAEDDHYYDYDDNKNSNSNATNLADGTNRMDQDAIRASCRLALEKYGALEGLNSSQALAVEGATSNRLTLVQGPPGTGKTAVAIRILQHWARLAAAAVEKGGKPPPILATSDSNIAVDNLVEGCAGVGLQVVRLGRPEAIRPELLKYCIDRPTSSNSQGGQNNGYMGAAAFKERMKFLKNAQVICCTCIGSGGDILDSLGPLDRVLVDEATQATEAAVLVPLMRGCRQLVLVGDHCQLPPTVLSTRAEEEGHGVPLFSRMVACGVPPFMLDTQYRMHPCIAAFPSDLFYGGLLKNGVSPPERRPLAGFPWPREEFPVAFMPVKGVEMDDGVSKYNEAEAEVACQVVSLLLEGGQCTVSDIAVVTPYAAQARLIRRMARRLTQGTGPPYIEVSSVDGFQGREKEAVVFSAVRSNDYGAIGFTSDWRRVNVSFTRARRALIVIGNDVTLRRGDPDTWMPWLAWADAHGINMDKPGVPRGRYDPEQLRRVRGGTTAAEMLKDVLARQQAQLKNAEQQQQRAEKNSKGHIIAGSDDAGGEGADGAGGALSSVGADAKEKTLKEDLAMLENEDGNWDDSDDENANGEHGGGSSSRWTNSNHASSNASSFDDDGGDENDATPVDVWDL